MKSWIKRGLLTLGIILPCGLVLVLMQFISNIDPSTLPINKLNPKYEDISLHLVSYTAGKDFYKQNRNMLVAASVNKGFDFVYSYRKSHIDSKFYAENKGTLDKAYGAGYWLWKPYFILKTMRQVPEGDIVVYMDSGYMPRKPLKDYLLRHLEEEGKDVLLFAYNPEEGYSLPGGCATRDTFIAMRCDHDRCRYGHHVLGGCLAVRNSPKSRAFISSWLQYCKNPDLLMGTKQVHPNYPEFCYHQHDEALLSVLGNRESDVVAFGEAKNEFHQNIFMHRRKESETTLLGRINDRFGRRSHRFLNMWFMKGIKKISAYSVGLLLPAL